MPLVRRPAVLRPSPPPVRGNRLAEVGWSVTRSAAGGAGPTLRDCGDSTFYARSQCGVRAGTWRMDPTWGLTGGIGGASNWCSLCAATQPRGPWVPGRGGFPSRGALQARGADRGDSFLSLLSGQSRSPCSTPRRSCSKLCYPWARPAMRRRNGGCFGLIRSRAPFPEDVSVHDKLCVEGATPPGGNPSPWTSRAWSDSETEVLSSASGVGVTGNGQMQG